MDEHYQTTLFTYNKLRLNALLIDRQPWLCLRDLGRLMGKFLNELATRKLAPDEYRYVPIDYYGEVRETLMVSESAVYALLIYHHHPANQRLRRWLTYTVLPLLREAQTPTPNNLPAPALLAWQHGELNVMHWQNEPWIRLRDMPSLLPGRDEAGLSWWGNIRRRFL